MIDAASVRAVLLAASRPGRPVTDAMIDAARGPIPFDLLTARIIRKNPALAPSARVGSRGGLCMTPVDEAINYLEVDPADPWTSYLHLCSRILLLLAVRLEAYARVWEPIFSPRPVEGVPQVYAPCRPVEGAPVSTLAGALALTSTLGLDVLRTVPRSLPLLAGTESDADWACHCALTTGTQILTGAEPRCLSAGVRSVSRFLRDPRLAIDRWYAPAREIAVFDYPRPGTLRWLGPAGWASRLGEPDPWPWILTEDWGFWALILAEEYGPPLARVWEDLLGGGLPGLLVDGDPASVSAVGYAMVHHGILLYRNLYLEVHLRNPAERDRLASGYQIVDSALGPLDRNSRIVVPAPPAGALAAASSLLGTTAAAVTPATLRWAGGINTVPSGQSVLSPEDRARLAGGPATGGPGSGTRGRSRWLGPVVVGLGVLGVVGGALYLRGRR